MSFDFQQFIGLVGLPGAICIFVLYRLDKTVQANTKVMTMIATKLGVNVGEDSTK